MTNYRIPKPSNEPILGYLPNSPELTILQDTLERMSSTTIKMPLIIGGERIHTEEVGTSIIPHQKEQILGSFSMASSEHVEMAIQGSVFGAIHLDRMIGKNARMQRLSCAIITIFCNDRKFVLMFRVSEQKINDRC